MNRTKQYRIDKANKAIKRREKILSNLPCGCCGGYLKTERNRFSKSADYIHNIRVFTERKHHDADAFRKYQRQKYG